jgi:uncharacterized membrane protein YgcG
MSRITGTTWLRRAACAVVFGAMITAGAGCGVEVGPEYPVGFYRDYPPDAFIATTEPFYYNGRAAYWYGGRWNYRNGGGWDHYAREPAALYQQRMQGAPRARMYESSGGRDLGHAGGRSGGGSSGGRSGGGGRR